MSLITKTVVYTGYEANLITARKKKTPVISGIEGDL